MVTATDGINIQIDAPLTTTIDPEYGKIFIVKGHNNKEIKECGVENLSLTTEYDAANLKDEDHCWDAISIENARDCWVRRTNFAHFAGSAVSLHKHIGRITIGD